MSTGRPSSYTVEIGERVCNELMEGKTLTAICSADDMPHSAAVFRWLQKDDVFRNKYAHAREVQADTLADQILDIADDGKSDKYFDEDGTERVDHDVVARSRLRVDARKWYASKLAPKKYGEKVEHTGSVEITSITRKIIDSRGTRDTDASSVPTST